MKSMQCGAAIKKRDGSRNSFQFSVFSKKKLKTENCSSQEIIMKKFLSISLLTTLVMCLSIIGRAQEEKALEEKEKTDDGNTTVVQGTLAKLSLQTQLSSKINEVGDEVIAVLYENVRASDGSIAIPRGTEFAGRVTQVKSAKMGQKEATMTVSFETMRMPYGIEKVSTTITAIDDYANDEKIKSKDDEGRVGGGRSGGRTARNAGTLGTIGIIPAILLGGGIGTVVTVAGAGAAGGVLMTKGNDIKLAPGTILRIRFERDVKLPVFENSKAQPSPKL
jgi:hypothetical protein